MALSHLETVPPRGSSTVNGLLSSSFCFNHVYAAATGSPFALRVTALSNRSAAALLRSFIGYVTKYMAAGLLPQAQGQQLIAGANTAIGALGP